MHILGHLVEDGDIIAFRKACNIQQSFRAHHAWARSSFYAFEDGSADRVMKSKIPAITARSSLPETLPRPTAIKRRAQKHPDSYL
jgi:hypothetical protein